MSFQTSEAVVEVRSRQSLSVITNQLKQWVLSHDLKKTVYEELSGTVLGGEFQTAGAE